MVETMKKFKPKVLTLCASGFIYSDYRHFSPFFTILTPFQSLSAHQISRSVTYGLVDGLIRGTVWSAECKIGGFMFFSAFFGNFE